mmetsp:Transcript_19192/g.45112  ORF Transcript_19192/g.45112 Transcript_19192/m.45112 type:complete len:245 (-) Transcript_19192:582-1316(-)
MELHAHPLLHRLRGCNLRYQSVLVLFDVCPKCGWHCQRYSCRLGQLGRWRNADLHDVRTFYSNGERWSGSRYCVESGNAGPRSRLPAVRLGLKALLLGYADLQALRCDGHRQDQEALVTGLRRSAEGRPCCHHDLPVFGVFWRGARNEQSACNSFPYLLPAWGRRRNSLSRVFRTYEPLRAVLGRSFQRPLLPSLWLPGPSLGTVPSAGLRGDLPVRFWDGGPLPAVVCGLGCVGMFLIVCADG